MLPSSLKSNTIDSLEKILPHLAGKAKSEALQKIASSYFGSNPERAYKYYRNFYDESKKQNDSVHIGVALANIAAINQKKNNYNSALDTLQLAANVFERIKYRPGLVFVYSQIGTCYVSLGKYDIATQYHTKALSIYTFRELLDSLEVYRQSETELDEHQKRLISVLSIAYHDFGWNCELMGFYEKAIDLYKKSYQLGKALKRKDRTGAALSDIANVYFVLGNLEKAERYFLKAIDELESANHLNYLAVTCNNLSNLYIKLKKIDIAKRYANKSFEYFQATGDSASMVYITLAEIEMNLKNYTKAIKILKDAESIYLSKNMSNSLTATYDALATAYELSGDYKAALKSLRASTALKDSALSSINFSEINELLAFYDVDSKNKELRLYKKDAEITQSLLRQEELQAFSQAVIMAFLLSVIVVLAIYLRSKSKTRKLIESKNLELEGINTYLKDMNERKDKFFSIIAHDIRNPLASLKQVSELLVNDNMNLDEDERKEFTGSLNKSATNLLDLLNNLLTWARSQAGRIVPAPENISIDVVISQEIELLKGQAGKKGIALEFSNSGIEVFADYNMTATIVRNLISNAIKYTPNFGVVKVTAQQHNGEYAMVKVADSGVGLSEQAKEKLFTLDRGHSERGTADEEGSGLGLLVCKEFVKNNAGEIGFEDNVPSGATFYFTLPLAAQ